MRRQKVTTLEAMVFLFILAAWACQTAVADYIIAWGYNDYGQTTSPDGNDFVAVSATGHHSLALKSDGSIVGWGLNDCGEITPPDGNDFVAIATGYYHSLALKSDGSIVGWGNNEYGQATPPTGNDFTAIATRGYHSLALKSNGVIVGWGLNGYGQATPSDGNDFAAIVAGGYHSLALKSNGSIVGWGWNLYGQASPPDGNDFVAISAGWEHSLALKSDDSIVAWGNNNYGQASPPDGNDFVAIAAGHWHTLALKSDGSIVGWGRNTGPDNVPGGQTSPPDGNDFVAIAAGGFHSLALWHLNQAPVANAGTNQTVYAWIDGIADVNLDGSDSNDLDGDELTYKWTWTIDSNIYEANGVSPTIKLPVGTHTIKLVVNDGIEESVPDQIVIDVIGPLKCLLKISPRKINRYSKKLNISGLIRLPEGISQNHVKNDPLVLYPGEIKANLQRIKELYKHGKPNTVILALFNKVELMNAIPDNGQASLEVVGQLQTGQYFYGTDIVLLKEQNADYDTYAKIVIQVYENKISLAGYSI